MTQFHNPTHISLCPFASPTFKLAVHKTKCSIVFGVVCAQDLLQIYIRRCTGKVFCKSVLVLPSC